MNIKSIDTVYNGYKFRSRLEARWAVFFDTLNIKYEYEKEGIELPNGDWYLPDFYFPEYQWYGEVKPELPKGRKLENLRKFDDQPPEGTMGLLFLIGVPEVSTGTFGSTGHFLARTIGLNNQNMIRIAVKKAKSARFEFENY